MSGIQKIRALATRLRRGLEALGPNQLPSPMAKFPVGACGDAALLLGAYLADNQIGGFQYICGERGSHADGTWTSHAWLARRDLIVDITADQFSDGPGPIVVAKKSLWHECFESEPGQASDFRAWSGVGTHHLKVAYELLRPFLFDPDKRARRNG